MLRDLRSYLLSGAFMVVVVVLVCLAALAIVLLFFLQKSKGVQNVLLYDAKARQINVLIPEQVVFHITNEQQQYQGGTKYVQFYMGLCFV
eukprot:m.63987 g.63987  ORF g.63987 m.63987 type:complete len:90 (+) comp13472_c0_seq1:2640-2909(+)